MTFTEKDIYRMSNSYLLPSDVAIRKLTIGKPWVEQNEKKAIQKCRISLGDVEREVFFEVDAEFSDYLTYERGDAYLIGLLNLAMRERCDIYSEIPFTDELVHQIRTELIPALVKYSPKLYAPKIIAELQPPLLPLDGKGKIDTGCSCGIDSLYAIKHLTQSDTESIHLDYLVINNVGAFSSYSGTDNKRYVDNISNAINFSKQYGYKLIVTDSNFATAFPQDHLKTHLYSSCFAVHMMSKLWGRYYYASTGCDLVDYFDLKNNELYDAAKYDLIALPAFSTSQLRICNQGISVSRFEKTKDISDYEPAYNYLSVCIKSGKGSCGYCSKCMRTMWTLDALGKIDSFNNIFDVKHYKNNHYYYMKMLYRNYINGSDHMINEVYDLLKNKINLSIKLHEKTKYLIKKAINNIFDLNHYKSNHSNQLYYMNIIKNKIKKHLFK